MMTALTEVVPFRRGYARRPVNSIKHIIDSEGVLTGGLGSANTIATAVPNVDTVNFNPGDIRVGGTINGFFLSIFIIGATGAPVNGAFDWFLMKLHDQQTAPVPGNTGVSKLRNQIIHEEKGLVGSGDGTPMVFKGVIAVPKGMRRMREGDSWIITLRNTQQGSDDGQFCLKAIYKSYF